MQSSTSDNVRTSGGHIGRPKSKAGNRDIPLTPMVVNALRQWRVECQGELVFPNEAGNVVNHANLVSRFWEPLQVATGMAVDSGRRNDRGEAVLAGKYGFPRPSSCRREFVYRAPGMGTEADTDRHGPLVH